MKNRPSAAILRLICVLAVSLGLIGLQPQQLLIFSGLLLFWCLLFQRQSSRRIGARIWRMRWFFLAIALLYGLGNPGLSVSESWIHASFRVGVLVCLVAMVSLCLDEIPAPHLANALNRLLAPFALIGLPIDAFSRRLALSLQTVQLMDAEIQQLRANGRHQAIDKIAKLCINAEHSRMPLVTDDLATRAGRLDYALLIFLAGGLWVIKGLA